jgi:hypothetical protein
VKRCGMFLSAPRPLNCLTGYREGEAEEQNAEEHRRIGFR